MRFVLILIWLVLLVGLCLSPWEVKAHLHSMGRYHHLFHLLAFAITGILLVGGERSLVARTMAVFLTFSLAFTTELLEQWRFHNPFEWVDVLSDSEGILLGIAILALITILNRYKTHIYS
jgi:hypothetical protein